MSVSWFAESKALNDSDTLVSLKLEDGAVLYFKDLGEWTVFNVQPQLQL